MTTKQDGSFLEDDFSISLPTFEEGVLEVNAGVYLKDVKQASFESSDGNKVDYISVKFAGYDSMALYATGTQSLLECFHGRGKYDVKLRFSYDIRAKKWKLKMDTI